MTTETATFLLRFLVVFQGDTDACHRETSGVSACLTREKSALACVFMLCPGIVRGA